MIGYALVGSNDLPKAMAFYEALLAPFIKSAMPHPSGGKLYIADQGKPMFGVVAPHDGKPATAGNGTMISFLADNHQQVRDMHAKALELGGTDEGAPGWRGQEGGFYGCYFRDLDGNKLCAYIFGPEA